ncbi:MAG TPA: CdaR family protein [Anaerolineales bacterium]|nr:CdaR family protein [Anaerolineales bacterium]
MSGSPFLKWLNDIFSLMLLALLLAFIVWVAAVFSADPNEECTAPRAVPLQVRGLREGHILFENLPDTATVRLFAPRSICQAMAASANSVQAYIDLSTFGPGVHQIDVTYEISDSYEPVKVLGFSPDIVTITLEEFATRIVPIELHITGQPAPGYTAGATIISDSRVVISGTRSVVDQVAGAVVSLDISNAVEEINVTRAIQILDGAGEPVPGLEVSPTVVTVRQLIDRPGSFREVIVRVIYTGVPADGYRLTSITPTPQIVTLFANDPLLIRDLPGFVETEPIDLTNATDDLELRLRLVLPDGVFVDGEQSVLVQIGIAAIESSITLTLPIESIGLAPGLEALLSPDTVDMLLSGPLPVLTGLQPLDVRVVLDMAGLLPGEYTLAPRIEIIPLGVTIESILPSMIDVEIVLVPTPTPGLPVTPAPTPTGPTPTPTPTATETPF